MQNKKLCKYYDKYEKCCRISSCSCGATHREPEHDDLLDDIVTGASIAVGLCNLFDSSSSSTDSPSSDWSGGGGDSGGGGADGGW